MKVRNSFFLLVALFILASCGHEKSSITGWNYNDPDNGGFQKYAFEEQETGPNLVLVEGGTFTMGRVEQDFMFDWNNVPRRVTVSSYYMDQTEISNFNWLEYLYWVKRVYGIDYPELYKKALPDTLVWRTKLAYNEPYVDYYLRHPAYREYPVVGVNWLQATDFCSWRTDRVNEYILIREGILQHNVDQIGEDNFNTDAYLSNQYNSGKRIEGLADLNPNGAGYRNVKMEDGILLPKYRLPTEAEWEFAAKANIENREYNNIRGRKKYAWNSKYTREKDKRFRGDQLANFKQGQGEYSGLSGWSSDGSDIPIRVKAYPPNGFGLYDMSGNVAEWVQDVYRPIIDNDANDFNYFRGNIFTKKMIDKDGKVVIADGSSGEAEVEYDTLPNGKITPKQLPGSIKYIPITRNDATLRRNFSESDNTNIGDGDLNSSRFYSENEEDFASKPSMYNSPRKPSRVTDPETGIETVENDAKNRTTLISNKTRVYKGGAWSDREYWLDPAQRRYLPEYMATNYIGFRCVTDKLGPMTYKKRNKRNPSR
jgi:sulfatase modifying factor 1